MASGLWAVVRAATATVDRALTKSNKLRDDFI